MLELHGALVDQNPAIAQAAEERGQEHDGPVAAGKRVREEEAVQPEGSESQVRSVRASAGLRARARMYMPRTAQCLEGVTDSDVWGPHFSQRLAIRCTFMRSFIAICILCSVEQSDIRRVALLVPLGVLQL